MIFTVFNRDALIGALDTKVTRIGNQLNGASASTTYDPMSIDQWDQLMSERVQTAATPNEIPGIITQVDEPLYADELPPFDVTISFANEYVQKAVLTIYGVEIINEGTGFSIDSVTTEKACTFVARKVDYMRSVNDDGSVND